MIRPRGDHLSVIKKAELLLRILNKENLEKILEQFTPGQLQEIRNYLESQVLLLTDSDFTITDIKSHFEPIPNYYYRQDCREPLEACFNETCMANNPQCFSNKMRGQINVLLSMLSEHMFVTPAEPDKAF